MSEMDNGVTARFVRSYPRSDGPTMMVREYEVRGADVASAEGMRAAMNAIARRDKR